MHPLEVIDKLIIIVVKSKVIKITENINEIRYCFIKFLRSIKTEHCIQFLISTVSEIIIKIFRKSIDFSDLLDKLRIVRYLETHNKFIDNMILCTHLNNLIHDLKNIYTKKPEIKNINPEFYEKVKLINIWAEVPSVEVGKSVALDME